MKNKEMDIEFKKNRFKETVKIKIFYLSKDTHHLINHFPFTLLRVRQKIIFHLQILSSLFRLMFNREEQHQWSFDNQSIFLVIV